MSQTMSMLTAVELTNTLRDQPEFAAWWERHANRALDGREGLARFIADHAERLEGLVQADWIDRYDWYLTCDAVAHALLAREADYLDDAALQQCLVPA